MIKTLKYVGNALVGTLLLACLVCLTLGMNGMATTLACSFFIGIAILVNAYPRLKGFSFTLWVLASAVVALAYPGYFIRIGSFELKTLMIPLLQIIMFGMGTTMSLKDFSNIVAMPKGVALGILCQYAIMPFLALGLAKVFGFGPEIAVGIILVGSSPGGLASNVMTYLAKGNVALSITLTTISTMLSPLLTPFLMKTFGSAYIEIHFFEMMWSIVKIVIFPVIAGLALNYLFRKSMEWLNRVLPLISMAGIIYILAIIIAAGRNSLISIGVLLLVAVILHNLLGFLLGYGVARFAGLDRKSCRTIAFEVGMQNSGLASGIALQMGKLATVGLAPALFSPIQNVTGSILANIWSGNSETEA